MHTSVQFFLISNDKILTKQKDIQDLKIIGLIKGKRSRKCQF